MKSCLIIALVIVSAGYLRAQDAAPADAGVDAPPAEATEPAPEDTPPSAEEEDGPAIPIAFDLSRYEATWDKNPFLLKVIAPTQQTVNWGQDWALAGMYSYKGKIQVSMRNKQTNEFKRITNSPKEGDEFRLVEAKFHRSKKEASAKIAKGTEEAELKYDENAAPVTINNTVRTSGSVNGQQGAPGGMPQGQGLPGRPGGQPSITKPMSPTANGRVFNAPNLPGGVSQPGGMIQGGGGGTFNNGVPTGGTVIQPGVMNPTLPVGANGMPPTISRRRQLIPAPVVSPQSNP